MSANECSKMLHIMSNMSGIVIPYTEKFLTLVDCVCSTAGAAHDSHKDELRELIAKDDEWSWYECYERFIDHMGKREHYENKGYVLIDFANVIKQWLTDWEETLMFNKLSDWMTDECEGMATYTSVMGVNDNEGGVVYAVFENEDDAIQFTLKFL